MASQELEQLPAAVSLADGDLFYLVRNGVDYSVTKQVLAAALGGVTQQYVDDAVAAVASDALSAQLTADSAATVAAAAALAASEAQLYAEGVNTAKMDKTGGNAEIPGGVGAMSVDSDFVKVLPPP